MAWSRAGRPTAIALFVGAGVLAAWAVACGLPQGGLGPGDDGGSDDGSGGVADGAGVVDQTPVPPSCSTIDAGCLGALLSGWQPVSLGDAGCGPAFDAATLHVNARLPPDGCRCGPCQIIGSFDCTAPVDISGGNNCTDPTLVSAAPGVCTQAQAQHVEAYPNDATGSVGCLSPDDAGAGVVTDTLTICVPGCAADYCGSSPRCILADGEQACPAGFTRFARAGTGADPGCAPCPCEAGPPGRCDGTVTVYDNTSCTDSGAMATYALGTCNTYPTDYQSVLVQTVAPAGACSPTQATPSTGDASLVGVKTICCQ
ncbi:MAG TPA: hypothetical protein VIF15_07150 [Polyangiaceae bacterium]